MDVDQQRRTLIIGGGITGLATAHALRKAGERCVTVLESEARVGGNIRTERRAGFVLDEGPDAWLVAKKDATQLARDVGLGARLVETNPRNRRAYLATDQENRPLLPLPEGLMLGVPTRLTPMITTRILTAGAKVRAALDLVLPAGSGRRGAESDESIGDFIARRLGPQVRDRIAAPLLGGIHHGDVSTLSLQATFPHLAALEAKGGLIRGSRRLAGGAPRGSSPFVSLLGGVGELVDALAESLGARVQTGVRVTRVYRLPDGDVLGRYCAETLAHGPLFADELILAVPGHAAATMVRELDVTLSEALTTITYASTATVFLAYQATEVSRPLDGVGYLVPPSLHRDVAGATFISSKWPARAPIHTALFRVFFPSGEGRDVTDESDATLVDRSRAELRRALGIVASPHLTHVARFSRATPVPLVGHLVRVAHIKSLVARNHGLHLVGSGFDGFGIGDCVRQANELAATLTRRNA